MEQVTGTTIGDVIDRTSTAKDIASMSQDSADELNGNFYALLIYADRTNQGDEHPRAVGRGDCPYCNA
ncbi:MAG: hypothetical protein ACLR6J_00480 [Parabacteroides merdae]